MFSKAPQASQSLTSITDSRQFALSSHEFDTLRELVQKLTGIHLSECKREMIYRRLAKRLDLLGLKTFTEYCKLLESGDTAEIEDFANAMTTNLTYFFREPHHFEYMQHTLIPEQVHSNRERKLRIWSAGCSSGEEPYSLAILLQECLPDLSSWDVKILATDLDSSTLSKAKSGVYRDEQIERIPNGWADRWFTQGRDNDEIIIDATIRKMIYFRHHNLMGDWPMSQRFNLIFCRNVIIYFDKDTQRKLFERFATLQQPEDHLFIGHSETLHQMSEFYDLIGQTIYKRT